MATMSHEIRTPLTAVIGFSEKLKQETQDAATIKTASAILGSSRHLLAIVNDVLDFTRIESGKLRFSEESFRLDAVFAEVHEALAWKAAEKNIDLSLYAQPVAGAVLFGDPVRLKQVLYNLTGNAIKFTDKGGVTVTATLVDEEHHPVLIFKVSDTGCGIPAEKLNSIFDEYEQADPNSEKGRAGTGLGLAISKRIVSQMGGTIEVESQPELGSVFKVRIPFKWGENQFSEQSFTEEPDKTLFRGYQMLVAEDDPLISDLVVHYLNRCGAEVESVSDGASALNLLVSKQYHLLIIDRQLPSMNGNEVIAALRDRKDALSSTAPAIMMTAHIRPEDESNAEKGWIAGLIAKPFAGNDLISKVKVVLEKQETAAMMATPEIKQSHSVQKEDQKPYDLSELYRASAGDKAYVEKMLNLFLTSTYASVNNLKFHLKTGNAEQIGKTAHKMLGSFRQLGMEELAELLKDLELTCEKEKQTENAIPMVNKLDKKLLPVIEMLKKEILNIKQS
jgi:DNA-binding response OmpR family regulator/anti-sigma regulatory factor (Ser/Thr protein kinase)